MVSPRRGRVLPAEPGGRARPQGRAVRARAPTRCSAATTGTRRCSTRPATGSTPTRRVLRPRRRGRAPRSWPRRAGPRATRRARSRRAGSARRARTRRSTARCGIDAEVMLVDDPVKRVDNMTMAHGLEARTPFLDHDLVELAARCPPELKLADGGKGVLKRAAPRRRARRGDRPAQGLLPRARALAPRGAGARAGARRADLRRRARPRPVPARGVEAMLADPNAHRTNLDGSTLWQLGLLELWLQAQTWLPVDSRHGSALDRRAGPARGARSR